MLISKFVRASLEIENEFGRPYFEGEELGEERTQGYYDSGYLRFGQGKPRGQVRDGRILELGCGKGGDMRKWGKSNIREMVMIGEFESRLKKRKDVEGLKSRKIGSGLLTLILFLFFSFFLETSLDIADVSVDQARTRYEEFRSQSHRRTFDAEFFAFDCFSVSNRAQSSLILCPSGLKKIELNLYFFCPSLLFIHFSYLWQPNFRLRFFIDHSTTSHFSSACTTPGKQNRRQGSCWKTFLVI